MRLSTLEARKNIGFVIRDIRRSKNLSQGDLAERAGITQTFLSLVEHGKRIPSYEVLGQIGAILGKEAGQLEREATTLEEIPEIRLNLLLKRLIGSRNRKKLKRLLEFVETLG